MNSALAAGSSIGPYRVRSQLGQGGMGVVYLAEHPAIGRKAAIKVLNASMAQNAEIVTRFFNEARAATAISDPGIVQVFDFGYHTDGSPGSLGNFTVSGIPVSDPSPVSITQSVHNLTHRLSRESNKWRSCFT